MYTTYEAEVKEIAVTSLDTIYIHIHRYDTMYSIDEFLDNMVNHMLTPDTVPYYPLYTIRSNVPEDITQTYTTVTGKIIEFTIEGSNFPNYIINIKYMKFPEIRRRNMSISQYGELIHYKGWAVGHMIPII